MNNFGEIPLPRRWLQLLQGKIQICITQRDWIVSSSRKEEHDAHSAPLYPGGVRLGLQRHRPLVAAAFAAAVRATPGLRPTIGSREVLGRFWERPRCMQVDANEEGEEEVHEGELRHVRDYDDTIAHGSG